MLRCSDDSYYIGHTEDLESRLIEHNYGTYKGYTSERLPVSLVWYDEFNSRDEAFERERQIKGWSRAKKEALIKGNWEELKQLSKSKTNHPSTSSG